MNKTNEQVQAGVVKYWERKAKEHGMTVDEYHAYRKEQNEQRRKEWGLSMADAITVDDAESLKEYAESLGQAAMGVLYGVRLDGIPRETLGKQICDLHDRLRLVTAVLDRIDENRH